MKAHKIITITTIILAIIIISIASFGGIYKLKEYKVVNVVPDYLLGMKFNNSRVANFTVSNEIAETKIYDKDGNEVTEKQEGVEYTEENGYTTVETKVNSEESLTTSNYKLAKKILEKRLKDLKAEQYTIKLDEKNGNIQVETSENKDTDEILAVLAQKGVFELQDSETKEVLLNNSNIKSTAVVYGQTESGVAVYLQIKFDKDGTKKLEEISKKYVKTTEKQTNENGEEEDKEVTKEVSILFDGQEYRSTYFGDTITDGTLNVAMGSGKDSSSVENYVLIANELKAILNSGILPIQYEISENTVSPRITTDNIKMAAYVVLAIFAISLIYFVIKLKLKGLLAAVLQIGYTALLLLTLRYTNVVISLEGIVGILVGIILNYMFIYFAFKNVEGNFVKDIMAKFAVRLIPIYIIAIVFTFNRLANIASLGMTLVWGLIILYVYNLIFTQVTLKEIKK
ncbi:protein translocase subunit SecD [Clostridium sp. CAG:452]|nr:protein translocase subunit SecD [Clostridium sp. CAG:452]